MSSKKGSMLYFAELDYKHILHIQSVEGLEDSVLVTCEQCVEKYLKYLISEKLGETEGRDCFKPKEAVSSFYNYYKLFKRLS